MQDTQYRLRDGSSVSDKRLDRLIQFDDRSRNFPIRQIIGIKPIRSYTWSCPVWLDQGSEGACVGFGLTQKMAARYAMIKNTNNDIAMAIYKRAQFLDEWEGQDYSGTSVLGGLKAAKEFGYISSYYWGLTLQEVLLGIAYKGGGVAGTNWYTGMKDVDEKGYIHVTGDIEGGHGYFVRAGRFYPLPNAATNWRYLPNWLEYLDMDKSYVTIRNSWGIEWGYAGDCFITVRDFARLLKESGEFAILVRN